MDRTQIVAEVAGQLAEAKAYARCGSLRGLLDDSVSLTHLHVLTVLQAGGSYTMGDLAQTLGVSLASGTGIVTRMEERGLIIRARDERDRRVVTVMIAPGGLEALEAIEGQGREHLSRLLDTLTIEELGQLRNGLAALRRAHREFGVEPLAAITAE